MESSRSGAGSAQTERPGLEMASGGDQAGQSRDTGGGRQHALPGATAAPQGGAVDSGCTHSSGISLFPRILGGSRRSSYDRTNNEGELPDSTNISSNSKQMGISVSLQTDESWLYENSGNKKDIFSNLVGDFGDLSVLSDMELNSDFIKLFEESPRTHPTAGLPTILAYKPESSDKDRDYSKIQFATRGQQEYSKSLCSNFRVRISPEEVEMLVECSVSALCEFCGKNLKPFPLNYLLNLEKPEQLFCCKEFQNLFQSLFLEQTEKQEIDIISVAPHPPYGSEIERQKAREKTAQRLRERQMAQYYASMTTKATDTASVSEYGKHVKTITYQLSNAPPSGENWTLAGKLSAEETFVDDVTDITCDFSVSCEKLMPKQFIERYYKDGEKFLTIFPDATAQLFYDEGACYPSGNLAVIVTHVVKDFLCIVQEDKSRDPRIQALFASNGKGTCYHPNGNVWINTDTTGGQYLGKAGNRLRTWKWENKCGAETPSSFKPIFISLNHNIGVRIFGQDRIIISYLAMGRQAKFSVGVKLEVKDPEVLPTSSRDLQEEELLLLAKKIQILSLFSRLHGCLRFSSKKQLDKMKTPSYLVSQTQKLIHLCRLSSVGGDLGASIKALLEEQQ